MAQLIYDGTNIHELCAVEQLIFKAMPDVRETSQEVPGRDGAVLLGADLAPLDIVARLRVAAAGIEPAQVQAAWREIAPKLRRTEPCRLSYGTDVYYMAIVVGATDIQQISYSGTVEVTFRCFDPIAYGDDKTAQVPSGGSVEITVGGTYKTALKIEAPAAVRDSSSGYWGIRVDDADFVHIATGSSASRRVVVDSGKRTATVAGSTALPSIDSDWLVLSPGTHNVSNDLGSGGAVISWTERWL
ncbi:MAG: phage tail family protein [Eggerthellaceae bacterium]|nr:phage tail family protein [Eggerthellaceae bacterium]